MKNSNEKMYEERRHEVDGIIARISRRKSELESKVQNPSETFAGLKGDEREKFHFFLSQWIQGLSNARFLEKSPFFVRLVVKFDDKPDEEVAYIGKFSFLDDRIYSWTVPIAGLRFAPLGPFSYTRPNGQVRSGVVIHREDYFIANGKIVSLHDLKPEGRMLVYDEHLSVRKTGFGLSDIVRELERAQNEIIVLDPKGPMVISGPAGSGKTTLALHRVAYLLQNPDTSETYKPESTIVFIQDEQSIGYFSSLFANLGVENVQFTTFEKWVASLLDLSKEHAYVDRYGDSSVLRDWYEWNKVAAVRDIAAGLRFLKDPWKCLEQVYGGRGGSFGSLWEAQKRSGIFDKQDLTALMKILMGEDGGSVMRQKRVFKKKSGSMVPAMSRVVLNYDAVLVDEFENYTGDQLSIIRATLSQKASCLLVGDIRQQTRFGSISDFSQSEFRVPAERNIVLTKAYRNGRSVLSMLESLGYQVAVDNRNDSAGTGEWSTVSDSEAEAVAIAYAESEKDAQIGIVCFDEDRLLSLKESFARISDRVHVGTVMEFQGLEFDSVFVFGVNLNIFLPTGLGQEFDRERSVVLRERLYVAITRARQNITVFSNSKIDEIMLYLGHCRP